MCDHCSKVTNQKGYSGQVTCKCDAGGKKEVPRGKSSGGCCAKKEKKQEEGCGNAKCCAGTRVESAGCCGATRDKPQDTKKSCCK